MDFERTSAPHNLPPPIQPSPFDWLLKLRTRAGGAVWPSVLVGAGIAALVQAGVLIVLNALGVGNNTISGVSGLPRAAEVASLYVGDVAGGFAVGVMARSHPLPTAVLTGVVLRLPRALAVLRGSAPLFVVAGVHIAGPGSLALVAGGLITLSAVLWVAAAWAGHATATRRLTGLGLL